MDIDYNDHSNYPFIAILEANAERIAAEGLALREGDFLPMPDEEHSQHGGSWVVCPLALGEHEEDFPADILAKNRAACPETFTVLSEIEGLVIGGFVMLKAGGQVLENVDTRDDDVIRVQLALRLPEHDREEWSEGRVRLRDARLPYATRNTGSVHRLTLLCDVRVGFDVPDGVITPWTVTAESSAGEE